ncbi:undecaprenyldiphospho-muramoylpentapeptide beta-N-acetylglucosaminyltransferase [Coriobacteriia bacterium Es71-Z0120]|uniref:undecaprenyldiphospho-muramoylpentapeptide beta-N-acetylglucosaminyltransferase n=1 Tax=Parvivirga hydrogeniphila TaxID=2939460 RepID=UPI002260D42C|nr:undecaprenyldiphospho-muramoylpentapeptide beta-N-acetylglucosaminyltransferase [Parvivirga hydrogeniphila]MCL4079105.1 undecaprenyldiphospho-muramoylpentapeptide beta-N-acetylglucosaminyltransferase [Parvivirga hydrogeniphila]
MRFLLSGGGTAGHIYPALTVARILEQDGRDEVIFVGAPDSLEARLVGEAGIRFVGLPAAGFDRARPITLVTSGARVVSSVARGVALIWKERPDAVVGFGGYASLPVGIAAALTKTPLVVHEQNSVPGLANRFLSRFAQAVAVTYPGSVKHLKRPERAVVTGNPVREQIRSADRSRGREALGLAGDSTVLLVFGGSRGARHINEALVRIWPRLASVDGLQVVHVAGRIEAASVAEAMAAALSASDGRYQLHEYIDDMGSAIAAADVIVSRAGATSLAEITAIGRAAVLVPYPYATDDHQTLNARAVAAAGAALVVPDAELDGEAFVDAVMRLVSDARLREEMAAASAKLGRPDAGERVAALVHEVVARAQRKETP